MPDLVLGPVLRYVDDTQATVWVQTDGPCEVEVLGHRARTFAVDGHHFAVVAVTGLAPGTRTPYGVALDGRDVWPRPEDPFPASVVRTLDAGGQLRLVFGSCREVAPHEPPFTREDAGDPRAHGLDALRAYALELARRPETEWPDALLMLGDQLYADEPPRRLIEVMRRRDPRPDGDVRADGFADYAALYRESWCEPAVRWLLSTVPSMMIFDDHEIVDEWNISQAWVDERRDQPWYERRVTAGLMAYWVFQHVGNLSPAELAADDVVDRVRAADDDGVPLREFAATAHRDAGRSRWSFCRDLGRARLLVFDVRTARRLQRGDRRIVDDVEWSWAAARATEDGDVDHVLMASSLPFLLPAGLHRLEAAIERVADGAWGRAAARGAEHGRRALNLGHWASFQASFRRLETLLDELRTDGRHGGPASVLLLSGDVHHGYLARFRPASGAAAVPVWQIVSSPFRKHLAAHERAAMRLSESRVAAGVGALLARAAGVAATPGDWRLCVRPSYHNQIAILELEGRRARVRLQTPDGSDWRAPRLRTLWERRLA
jgi:hypothetical protein